MLDSFTRGDGVERALNDWKSWRATLAAAVQGYLGACADLTTVCASFSHQPHQQKGIERALLVIDAELTGLASEEAVLRNARASLAAARNLSMTLAPIHTLPPEILANIFFIVRYGWDMPPAQLLAGVSSYWRQVAIRTSLLWTYIDIETTQTNFDYATLSLDRSNICPIHLTIFGVREGRNSCPTWEAVDESFAFLIQASRQIRTLDIQSDGYHPKAINMVMDLWLSHSPVGVTKTLRVQIQNDVQLDLASVGLAGEVLRSVRVLHLDGAAIPWTSTVYHNLVDLRLRFSPPSGARISISQFATVLASSLGLVTLKIRGLEVTPSDGWNPTTTVQLIHLELLSLDYLSCASCKLLLPLISLSACLNDLSIGLRFYDPPGIALIQSFLRDTPTRTLACIGSERDPGPQWGLSLLGSQVAWI
ncbi:hypothetical protein FRC10_004072 [Ceratobasidium sp. 414]|nr:hypothetical protein FRC10_004072 [Ceratobasidium sp. 414]